ncbi:type II secretion system F family protein [Cohnella sp. GCM10020058]|uniref:type II secretion system F family protein n=1 Tax=Cohnella sp. GCM10020058 TaxID=3317330 RepID=UPI003641FD1D
MDLSLVLICGLFVLFVFILSYPLLVKNTEISDRFYMLRESYRKIAVDGKNKQWMFAVQRLTPYMHKKLLGQLDRLLRLSGRSSGRSAEEMLLIYVLTVVPLMVLATQLENAKIQAMIVALFYPALHIRRLITRKNRRQLEAEEATRFMKRQLVLILQQNIPVVEALHMMADDHPGEFGVTFRKYLQQIDDGRSLREAMKDFREEYETRSLDDLCLAIELADQKSPEMLAEQLYLQTQDENARVDEFIDKKKESSKGMMLLVVGISFVWTLGLIIYFAWYGFIDYFRGGGGFLNF